MKKPKKGALIVVLAGSITFAVANALLVNQPIKLLAKITGIAHPGFIKAADNIFKSGKPVTSHSLTLDGKEADTSTHKSNIQTTSQTDSKSIVKSETNQTTSKSTQPVKTNSSESTASTDAHVARTSSSTTAPKTTSKSTTGSTTTNTSSTSVKAIAQSNDTTTTTNHGEQVSSYAKENATSNKDTNKGKNGKNM